jgi:hypothetical protein
LSPAHDLWANRPRAWEVYRVLVDHGLPVSASDLAQSVGASRSSVYHALNWLCGLGLVVHQDRQWVAIGETAALKVVATLNLPAVSEARHQRFAKDREKHRKRIAEKAPAQDGPSDPALSVYGPVFDLARAGSNPKFPGRPKRRASGRGEDSHRHGAA